MKNLESISYYNNDQIIPSLEYIDYSISRHYSWEDLEDEGWNEIKWNYSTLVEDKFQYLELEESMDWIPNKLVNRNLYSKDFITLRKQFDSMKELTNYEISLENAFNQLYLALLKGNKQSEKKIYNQALLNPDNGFLKWLIDELYQIRKIKFEFYWKLISFIVNFNYDYFHTINDDCEKVRKGWWDEAFKLDYQSFKKFYFDNYDLSFETDFSKFRTNINTNFIRSKFKHC